MMESAEWQQQQRVTHMSACRHYVAGADSGIVRIPAQMQLAILHPGLAPGVCLSLRSLHC
jgi:hypothetical protein